MKYPSYNQQYHQVDHYYPNNHHYRQRNVSYPNDSYYSPPLNNNYLNHQTRMPPNYNRPSPHQIYQSQRYSESSYSKYEKSVYNDYYSNQPKSIKEQLNSLDYLSPNDSLKESLRKKVIKLPPLEVAFGKYDDYKPAEFVKPSKEISYYSYSQRINIENESYSQHYSPLYNNNTSESPGQGNRFNYNVNYSNPYSTLQRGTMIHKRPRRKYHEVKRIYACGFPNCNKAYGALNHLNSHILSQGHGTKKRAHEFYHITRPNL